MLHLKSEWVRAVQYLKDAEAAECLSELKAFIQSVSAQVLGLTLIKQQSTSEPL